MKVDQGSRSGTPSPDTSDFEDCIEEICEHLVEDDFIAEVLSPRARASEDSHDGPEAAPAVSVYASESKGPDADMDLRSYQREMYEQSMRRNVIVTMDTGTGKTRVAIMRIQTELERGDENKIVWFLAPKVVLCDQQYNAIKKLIPAASITLLTGEQADSWKEEVWEAVLSTTRIVVSTPAILRNALCHAFISMNHLGLIVIDEAHNATKNSDSRRIMTDFYHPQKERELPVPSILGLSASPSMNSTKAQLFELEETLDALCVAPTVHRGELFKYANRPQVRSVMYTPLDSETAPLTANILKLFRIYRDLDIKRDPYIIKLKADPTERNIRRLRKAVETRDTWSQKQIRGLLRRARVVLEELGPWAADRYIYTNVRKLLDTSETTDAFFDAASHDSETVYLTEALGHDWEGPSKAPADAQLSEKCHKIIRILLEQVDKPVGIIFVKERVMVTMLKEVLSSNPVIQARYRIGTQVGANTYTGRTRELFETKEQANSLPDFNSGKVNLMIATSVLEEGIDIPACNLVICFDVPSNAKSFIQRRGRARMMRSELVLFLEDAAQSHLDWAAAEEAMKRLYEDEDRARADVQEAENSENVGDDVYIVPETGARLDLETSKSHLQHFCAVLARGDYVDYTPDYIITRDIRSGDHMCTVQLPSFVAPDLRRADSLRAWKSEKNATKDAAFQAYKALHLAGWLNDHLLPFRSQRPRDAVTQEAIVEADQLMCPWTDVARAWQEAAARWKYPLTCLDDAGSVIGEYVVVLPVEMTPPGDITIYLDGGRDQVLRLGQAQLMATDESAGLPDHTSTLLGLHFKHRWHVEERAHVIQVVTPGIDMAMTGIGAHEFATGGDRAKSRNFFVRDREGCPFIYEGIIPSKPDVQRVRSPFYEFEKAPHDVPYLQLAKWTKRSDFLHPVHSAPAPGKNGEEKPYKSVYPLPWARVDTIPIRYAAFGMLIPSVIHELEVMLLVQTLSNTLLKDLHISEMELIREAISSRSAAEPYHYERLEFLGDSILKYCTTVQLSADHLDWPEGYLSLAKDDIVSNSRLCRAALETRLPRFILTRPFTGQKWRPLYLINALSISDEHSKRRMSAKMLADVVEALIGASFADGGVEKALRCISVFIGEVSWREISASRAMMLRATKEDCRRLSVVDPVQGLIGYEFKATSILWEALTHASYIADSESRSLERLEFLGDAVLDYIVVTRLFNAEPKLTHGQMHMLKTALVNGDYLAFVALECRHTSVQKMGTADGELETQEVEKSLWMFMRHAAPTITEEQKATMERHERMRGEVRDAINHGTHYPWALLARLQSKKFYSDLIESLLGAVWLDSGNIQDCEKMLTKLGILPYLDRMLRDKVHVQHPKEELTKVAISEKIKYLVDVRETGDGKKEWLCDVQLGERIVVSVVGGVNKEEVQTKAAAEALVFLNAERGVGV